MPSSEVRERLYARAAATVGALSLLLTCACGSRSPDEQLQTELRTVSSWAATARKVCEDWQGGRVPSGYARQSLPAAQEELQKEGETLAQNSGIPADRRAGAQGQIARLKQMIGQAQAAIEHADGGALAQALQQLTDEAQTLGAQTRGAP